MEKQETSEFNWKNAITETQKNLLQVVCELECTKHQNVADKSLTDTVVERFFNGKAYFMYEPEIDCIIFYEEE